MYIYLKDCCYCYVDLIDLIHLCFLLFDLEEHPRNYVFYSYVLVCENHEMFGVFT